MPPPGSKLIGLLKADASDEEIQQFIDRAKAMAADESPQPRREEKELRSPA